MEKERKREIIITIFNLLYEKELITEDEHGRLKLLLQRAELDHESMHL